MRELDFNKKIAESAGKKKAVGRMLGGPQKGANPVKVPIKPAGRFLKSNVDFKANFALPVKSCLKTVSVLVHEACSLLEWIDLKLNPKKEIVQPHSKVQNFSLFCKNLSKLIVSNLAFQTGFHLISIFLICICAERLKIMSDDENFPHGNIIKQFFSISKKGELSLCAIFVLQITSMLLIMHTMADATQTWWAGSLSFFFFLLLKNAPEIFFAVVIGIPFVIMRVLIELLELIVLPFIYISDGLEILTQNLFRIWPKSTKRSGSGSSED